MVILSNNLEAEQIDISIQKEFEIDCCIRGYHCAKGNLLTACKEGNPASGECRGNQNKGSIKCFTVIIKLIDLWKLAFC